MDAQTPPPGLKIVRVIDPSDPVLPAAGRIVAEGFGSSFNGDSPPEERIWRRGLTPTLLEWRAASLRRFVQLDRAGKRARTYVAVRTTPSTGEDPSMSESTSPGQEGHTSPDDLLGVACSYVTSKEDPYDTWSEVVPACPPPAEDVNAELWAKTRAAFGAATQDHMGSEDAFQGERASRPGPSAPPMKTSSDRAPLAFLP